MCEKICGREKVYHCCETEWTHRGEQFEKTFVAGAGAKTQWRTALLTGG